MSEKLDYTKYRLDPTKDVLIPADVWSRLLNFVSAVESEHSTRMVSDKMSFYNKDNHKIVSENALKKASKEDIENNLYKALDLEKTVKSIRVDRDILGFEAAKFLVEADGVFKHNVDKGRAILIETDNDSEQS